MTNRAGTIDRRTFLVAAAAASVPGTARAQAKPPGWGAATQLAQGFDQIHALVIAHRGETVLSEVFRGPSVDTPVNVKSVSKTFVAALTGAAIDRGEIAGPGATLGEVAPDLIPAGADPRVRALTVRNLLTMQAGLERISGPNYGEWVASDDWVADALARPFVARPGERMLYSTGSYHVLGAALARVSGRSLLALARERIGAPLGIAVPAWTRDPQGFYLGGNQMALSPAAMIRFGEMYRRGGRWDATRVLSTDWVERSLVIRTRSPYSGLGYGYGWFLGRRRGRRLALARGYGGQVIAIVPELALTVAITSDPARPARSGGYFGDLMRLVGDAILPAAEAAETAPPPSRRPVPRPG